jgi:hypothetical protein
MMNTRYVAEFRNVEVTDEVKETERPQTSENIVNKKPITAQTVGKYVGGGIAITATAASMYSRYRATTNTITGNSVAQRSFDNKMAYVNEGLTIGGSIGVGLIVGGPAGALVAATAYAVSTSMKAYSVAMENRVKQAQWQVESLVNQEKQNRLVKDITGIRI